MNIPELKLVLSVLSKQQIVPLIQGQAGIGKSEAVKQVAKANEWGFFDFRTGICADAADIRGLPFKLTDKDGMPMSTGFLPPNELPREGKGIFFIDEINRGNKEVSQALFQLVLDRRVGEYVLPDGWVVVAAMNPPTEDYIVNDFDDAAFLDRFCQIKLEPSVTDWVEYARNTGLSATYVDWIRENPQFLNTKRSDFVIKASPSPRSNMRFAKLEQAAEQMNVPEHLIKEMGYGMIGIEATCAYYAYKADNNNKAFTAEQILNDFPKFKEKIEQYSSAEANRNDMLAVVNENLAAFMKATVMSKQQEANFVDYFCTLPRDLAMGFYRSTLLKDSTIRDNLVSIYGNYNDSLFGCYKTKTSSNPGFFKIKERFNDIPSLSKKKEE
jgi:hypothetical protein